MLFSSRIYVHHVTRRLCMLDALNVNFSVPVPAAQRIGTSAITALHVESPRCTQLSNDEYFNIFNLVRILAHKLSNPSHMQC